MLRHVSHSFTCRLQHAWQNVPLFSLYLQKCHRYHQKNKCDRSSFKSLTRQLTLIVGSMINLGWPGNPLPFCGCVNSMPSSAWAATFHVMYQWELKPFLHQSSFVGHWVITAHYTNQSCNISSDVKCSCSIFAAMSLINLHTYLLTSIFNGCSTVPLYLYCATLC